MTTIRGTTKLVSASTAIVSGILNEQSIVNDGTKKYKMHKQEFIKKFLKERRIFKIHVEYI